MALFNRTLTIGDLLDIDEGRIDRSKNLTVKFEGVFTIVRKESILTKFLNLFRTTPKSMVYKLVRYEVKSDSGNSYTVFIVVSPGFDARKFMLNKVQVFCTCSDFMYRAAYDLNKHGNLYLNQATKEHLGVEPLKIAPTKVSTTPVCKHIFACMNHLRSNLYTLDLIS